MGYSIFDKTVKFATTAGIASGDMNPNANLLDPLSAKVDGDYKGFVSLQELYAGKRVKSVFVMGGSKKLVRPLSTPQTGNLFSPIVDTFSNLIFTGFSLNYVNKEFTYKTSINPNLLVYWEQAPGNKFDLISKLTTDQKADNFLGTEFNIITKTYLCLFAQVLIHSLFPRTWTIVQSDFDAVKSDPLCALRSRSDYPLSPRP